MLAAKRKKSENIFPLINLPFSNSSLLPQGGFPLVMAVGYILLSQMVEGSCSRNVGEKKHLQVASFVFVFVFVSLSLYFKKYMVCIV